MAFLRELKWTRGGDRIFRSRWILGLVLFAVLVLGRVHGFSLGAWDVLFPEATAEYRFPSVGPWRAIRSDEWRASTPAVLAQCAHPDFFPRVNDRFGGGLDLFLAMPAGPVWDWTAIGQAHNWGYFLFGAERGLAWNWWIRYLGLFLFALEFFLIWTKGDRWLSGVGSLAVCGGAPTQWWDTTMPYLLLYFFAALVFLFRAIAERRRLVQWAWGAGLLVSLCSFGFSFYPPFQFMLGILWILLAADFARRAGRRGGDRWGAILVLGVVLGLWLAVGAYFFRVHRETLDVIRNSAYPGNRIYLGGGFKDYFGYFFYKLISLYTAFRDVRFMNNCVVSTYAVPFVALAGLGVQAWRQGGRPRPWLGYGLAAYGCVLVAWMLLPWPEAVAKYTGLFLVAPHRAPVAMSLAFLLLAFKAFDHCGRRGLRISWPGTLLLLSVALGTQAWAFWFYPEMADYFLRFNPGIGWAMLGAGTGIFLAMGLGLLRGSRRWFLGGYLACSLLSGAFVHPLCSGASPLLHKQAGERAKEIQREYGKGRWLTNEKSRAQLLLANGLACVNGIHPSANPRLWLAIDPARNYEQVWNRYAHISTDVVPGNESHAELEDRDRFVWKLCQNDIAKLGVRYLLWEGALPPAPWAIPLGRVGDNYFYRLAADVPPSLEAGHEP